MKYSESISEFLKFMRTVHQEYNIATSQEADAEQATQDLLHRLELGEDGSEEMIKIAVALRKIRRERREAKDICICLKPLIEWLPANGTTLRSLERLLGEVRKAEKSTENRGYRNRTSIIEETLEKPEEATEERIPQIKNILLQVHNIGGCDAEEEDRYSRGWDEAVSAVITMIEEETGISIEEVLD